MRKLLAVIIMTLGLLSPAIGQNDLMKSGVNTAQRTYTPAQLGVNALAFASGGTTADSTIVPLVGAYGLSLVGSCTQTGTLNLKVYGEDGATVVFTQAVATSITGGSNFVYRLAVDAPHSITVGTVSNPGPFLPQRAVSFSFTNTNASAGSCTFRLLEAIY